MTLPQGSRGVALLRVSDNKKQDHQSQREIIQSWLDKNGLAVVSWYLDSGSRHEAYKRQEFQRLLKDVEAGRVDWIITDTKDRFGTANIWEFGKFVCHLREHSTQLWSVAQGRLDTDDAVNSILSTVDSVRSRDEQVNKSIRSIRGAVSGAKNGEWQGGVPPYAFDVVCYGIDGQEKWRVLYTGKDQRLRLWPDGRPPDRFDGKGNFPGRDRGDKMRLALSVDKDRIETIKKIFFWLATEAISLRALARRLNDLKISPVINDIWYVSRLRLLLENPIYRDGVPSWGKLSCGDFREWRDGTYQEVEPGQSRGKSKKRQHPEADHVRPQPVEGLVDRDTWDRVQAKLAGITRTFAPRNNDLWLAGLLVCGGCGQPMNAWRQRGGGTWELSYNCRTYRRYGVKNSSGCLLHRVQHNLIESLLGRYLKETGEGLEALLATSAGDMECQTIAGLLRQQEGKQWDYLRALGRLWREVRASGARPPEGQPWAYDSLCGAYQAQASTIRADLTKQIEALDQEHSRLVEGYADLPGKLAREKAKVRIEALEAEIEAVRVKLEPLDLKVQAIRADLERLDEAVVQARKSLAGDESRRKAEAVRRVVRRIVCRFERKLYGKQYRSTLVEVRIEPVEGSDRTFAAPTVGRRAEPRTDSEGNTWPGG
jgi:DNA invertase Pin-like site-specific DNA recombinase